MTRLIAHQQIAETIIVAIWNTGICRYNEYLPQKPLELPEAQMILAESVATRGGYPDSDNYLRFIVEELKPFVDGTYRTLPDATNTRTLGSSMGGLISLYALIGIPVFFTRRVASRPIGLSWATYIRPMSLNICRRPARTKFISITARLISMPSMNRIRNVWTA